MSKTFVKESSNHVCLFHIHIVERDCLLIDLFVTVKGIIHAILWASFSLNQMHVSACRIPSNPEENFHISSLNCRFGAVFTYRKGCFAKDETFHQ